MRVYIVARDRQSGTEIQDWVTDYCEENRVQVETDYVTVLEEARKRIASEDFELVFLDSGFRQEPLAKEHVQCLLRDCLQEQKSGNDWFTYERNGKQVHCRVSEILYFESSEKRIRIVRKSGEDTFYGSINELAGKLEGQKFLFCHRSLLVNYAHIVAYHDDEVVLSGGEVLPVSRRKKQAVMEQLKEWRTT